MPRRTHGPDIRLNPRELGGGTSAEAIADRLRIDRHFADGGWKWKHRKAIRWSLIRHRELQVDELDLAA